MVTKIIFAHSPEGCYACRQLKPRFEKLMKEIGFDNVTYLDVSDEDNFEQADKYRVRGIPTVIFYDVNEEIGREVGNLPDNEYLKYFNN